MVRDCLERAFVALDPGDQTAHEPRREEPERVLLEVLVARVREVAHNPRLEIVIHEYDSSPDAVLQEVQNKNKHDERERHRKLFPSGIAGQEIDELAVEEWYGNLANFENDDSSENDPHLPAVLFSVRPECFKGLFSEDLHG